jgi:alpha-glucosidase
MSEDFLWWRDGVVYQIYPRSFADGNGDGIGDLKGILGRLDYLNWLGVDAIWLSPIYPSPDVDFGYDVSDYKGIDPKFGSLEDFDELVKQAHERQIRVILDLVLNHTSDQHPWFKASRSSRDNPFRDYYLWRDGRPGNKPPNNWEAVFGGSGWELDPQTGQYYFHGFYKQQPDVNWRNPQVRKEMLDVFRFWMERGVDGFRMDVFSFYFKDAQFRDNPSCLGLRAFDRQRHIYDTDQPEMIPFLNELRQLLDQYPERYAVGEPYLASPEKTTRYVGPDKLHAAFDFDFTHCPWRARRFLRVIERWQQVLPAEAWPTYVLNNHDVKRAGSRFGRGENDERLKVAAAMLLTQRGTPYLYYGEEIGMRDIPISRSQIQDPIGKRYWPFYVGRDGCRSPMQWSAMRNAGFSENEPWLPVHPNFERRNVETQKDTPGSLLTFYRALLRLRKTYPALTQGLFQPISYDPYFILAYVRQTAEQVVLVALNFSRRPMRLVLGAELRDQNWQLLLSNKREHLEPIKNGFLPLYGEEALLLVQE